jgi:hypothetical protein
MGCIFAPAFSTATLGVDGSDAGVASAMVNTSQQVGGSVGTALLSTIFASAVSTYTSSHAGAAGLSNAAAIHGYTTAFTWAAGIFALGLLFALLILPSREESGVPVAAETVTAGGTAVASPTTRPVTAVIVSGPCSDFGIAQAPAEQEQLALV